MSAAAWLDLKFRPVKDGPWGYEVVDLAQLPTRGEVTLGFVWKQYGRWYAKAHLPGERIVPVWEESPDGSFSSRRAAARAVELRVAREPDEAPEKPERELAEQPRLVFGGRR